MIDYPEDFVSSAGSSGAPSPQPFDSALRPESFDDYVGQDAIKKSLHVTLAAAKQRSEPVEHLLFAGPPGLGKTTLASLIARELEQPLRITSGAALERSGDLAAILVSLQPGEVLFIDEIHRLSRTIEEMLYPAMEDFAIDLILGKGPAARTMRLDLPRFTLIGATTKPGSLSSPLRDRFGLTYHLAYYTDNEITQIIQRSSQLLAITIDDDAARFLAQRSRRTPRVANRLVKRVRDYATVQRRERVTLKDAKGTLADLGIDDFGLDTIDRRILETIALQFEGGPVGVDALAAATSLERVTLEDMYEPYLLQIGFLDRTPRGRRMTSAAATHLGIDLPPE